MSEFFIFAGPQAAGKTTIIENINREFRHLSPFFRSKNPALFPLQESRAIVSHTHMLLGGIFMRPEHEIAAVDCDFKRMDLILERRPTRKIIHMDECNVFTLAHASAHGVHLAQSYWDEYIRRLKKLHAKIIFLDVPPDISWERRQARYAERLIYFHESRHGALMKRYRKYLETMHPLLKELLERLPFPKKTINGTLPIGTVVQNVSQALRDLSTSLR